MPRKRRSLISGANSSQESAPGASVPPADDSESPSEESQSPSIDSEYPTDNLKPGSWVPTTGTPSGPPGRQNLFDTVTVRLPPETPIPPSPDAPTRSTSPPLPSTPAAAGPPSSLDVPTPTPTPSVTPPNRSAAPPSDTSTPGPNPHIADAWFLATGAPPPIRADVPEEVHHDLPMPTRPTTSVKSNVVVLALVGALFVVGLLLVAFYALVT